MDKLIAFAGAVFVVGLLAIVPVLVQASDLNVSGDIAPWLSFGISTSTAVLQPALVSASGIPAIGSSTISFSVGTNSVNGWYIYFSSLNGALRSGSSTINSAFTPTSTLNVGTDNYGLNGSALLGGVVVSSNFSYGNSAVGRISTSTQTLAIKSTPNDFQQVLQMKISAVTSASKVAGIYSDVLYITALPQL